MKKSAILLATAVCAALLSTSATAAPQAKSYQVTGPVVEVTDTSITVTKGKSDETWQIARDAGTKIDGDLKVGAKITVHYRMVATDVEVKTDKAEPAAKPAKSEKSKKAEKP